MRCSICCSTPDAREAVNSAFAAGSTLLDIAKESGFSKSALSRHKRKCLPRLTLRAQRKILGSVKLTILRPEGIGGDPSYPPDPIPVDMIDNEVLVCVLYDKPVAPTAPPATPHNFADELPEESPEPDSHLPAAPEKSE